MTFRIGILKNTVSNRWPLGWLASLALSALLLVACERQGGIHFIANNAQGDECASAFDCPTGLACMDGYCKRPCELDEDCPASMYCDGETGFCVVEQEWATDGDDEAFEAIDEPELETSEDVRHEREQSDGDEEWIEEETHEDDASCELDREPMEYEISPGVIQCGEAGDDLWPSLTPAEVEMLNVPVGSYDERLVTLCNQTSEPFRIRSIKIDEPMGQLSLSHLGMPVDLPPGYGMEILVSYQPTEAGTIESAVEIEIERPEKPLLLIPIHANALALPELVANPPSVRLGCMEYQAQTEEEITIVNEGETCANIVSIEVESEAQTGFAVSKIIDDEGRNLRLPFMLESGEAMVVRLLHTYGERLNPAKLVILHDTIAGFKRFEAGLFVECERYACIVPVAGEGQEVMQGEMVELNAGESFDPNGHVLGFQWRWLEKPALSTDATFVDYRGLPIEAQWVTTTKAYFTADAPGLYRAQLTAKDSDEGCTGYLTDEAEIVAQKQDAVKLSLVWSDPNNDHDLHLIHPGGVFSRNCRQETERLRALSCSWCNCDTLNGTNDECPPRGCPGPMEAPDWLSIGERADDPRLIRDDTNGQGPEIIVLPELDEGAYNVVVENYSGRTGGRIILQVFTFGNIAAEFEYGVPETDEPLYPSHHWNVCTIEKGEHPFQPIITEINTVTPSTGFEQRTFASPWKESQP